MLHKGAEYSERIKNESYLINQEEIEWNFLEMAKKLGRDNNLLISIEDYKIGIAKNYLMIIIKELLDNAVKFSRPSTQIKLIGFCEGDYYKIIVSDKGCGITKGEIEMIEAFRQFDKEGYTREGVGLGLAIVKKILNVFKGRMSIDGRKDLGTTVRAFIPVMNKVWDRRIN